MSRPGGVRRRWWRWAVTGWAAAVAVGGGLTLALQEESEPKGPYVWENRDDSPPAPDLRGVPGRRDDHSCPPSPAPTGTSPDGTVTVVLCAYASSAG